MVYPIWAFVPSRVSLLLHVPAAAHFQPVMILRVIAGVCLWATSGDAHRQSGLGTVPTLSQLDDIII